MNVTTSNTTSANITFTATFDTRYDTSPLGLGKNWVTKKGGLPDFVRAVAHALERNGHTESDAIQLAIGVIKRWAAGGGHVHPKTRAKAAETVAHWEAMKAATGRSVQPGISVRKDWGRDLKEHADASDPAKFDADLKAKFFHGTTAYNAAAIKSNGFKIGNRIAMGKGVSLTADRDRAAGYAPSGDVLEVHADVHNVASPEETKKIVDRLAPGAMKGGLVYMTRPQSEAVTEEAKRLGHDGLSYDDGTTVVFDPKKLTVADTRDAMTEAESPGLLLPVGPPKKQSEAITAGLENEEDHRFEGTDLTSCAKCGHPITHSVHRSHRRRSADELHMRAADPDHVKNARADYDAGLASIEPGFEDTMKQFFAKQHYATLSRLLGKRGKQMMKRAQEPPATPEPGAGAVSIEGEGVAAGGAAPSLNPAAIFDAGFWGDQLAQAMQPHYAAIGDLAVNQVKKQAKLPAGVNDGTALASVSDVLADRAKNSAMQITDTTKQQIFQAVTQGVAQGESIHDIAQRINDIFDGAQATRAKTIAQTETVGALNKAASQYAQNLPQGTIGSKTWLAHHDTRTRPTHRIADGQNVPVDAPFFVGGFAMMEPGDGNLAPPSETINCRCGVAYEPPGMTTHDIVNPTTLTGLVPQSTLDALQAVQAEQAAKYPTTYQKAS